VTGAATRAVAACAAAASRAARAAARDEIDEALVPDLAARRDALLSTVVAQPRALDRDRASSLVVQRDDDAPCRRAGLRGPRVTSVRAVRARAPTVGAAVSISGSGACATARVEQQQDIASDLVASLVYDLSVHAREPTRSATRRRTAGRGKRSASCSRENAGGTAAALYRVRTEDEPEA
jgi:hypothetical protein